MNSTTVYRHLKEASRTSDDPPPRPRRRPDGLMPDAQIDAIEQVEWMSFGDSPLHGEGYRKVHARLGQGHRHIACASLAAHTREWTARQILSGTGSWSARSRRNHHLRRSVDEMWSTNMTTTVLTAGEHIPVFVAIDILSSRCVGLHTFDARHIFRGVAAHPPRGERMLKSHRRRHGDRPDHPPR